MTTIGIGEDNPSRKASATSAVCLFLEDFRLPCRPFSPFFADAFYQKAAAAAGVAAVLRIMSC